jgi:hypothetical protein
MPLRGSKCRRRRLWVRGEWDLHGGFGEPPAIILPPHRVLPPLLTGFRIVEFRGSTGCDTDCSALSPRCTACASGMIQTNAQSAAVTWKEARFRSDFGTSRSLSQKPLCSKNGPKEDKVRKTKCRGQSGRQSGAQRSLSQVRRPFVPLSALELLHPIPYKRA